MATAKKNTAVCELTVDFGNVSIGDTNARIGVAFERGSQMTLSNAEKTFCGKRLEGTIKAAGRGDNPQQGRLDGMDDNCELSGVFDVKGLSVSPKVIGFGLTFNVESLDVSELARFAKRTGTLTIESVGEIPAGESDSEE